MSTNLQLSPVQLAAVTHDAGPLVVLAGPGTGKTRVITHRVAHAITQRNVRPEQVLACTFTVAAARELRERLGTLIGAQAASRVRATTMHAFGARLISRYRGLLGLPSRTMLLDRVGQRRLLADVAVREGLFASALELGLKHQPTLAREDESQEEEKESSQGVKGIQSLENMLTSAERAIEAIANAGLLPAEALAQAQRACDAAASGGGEAIEASKLRAEQTLLYAKLNDAFCRERWSMGQLTFADLMLLPLLGLTKVPSIGALVRSDVRCIVVDEFQDCNPAQVRLLSLLAGPASSTPDVCVVGDDDQGIYAFRGASDRAFELFEALYPSPRVLTLEDNHRSSKAIVQVANHTIRLAAHRFRPDKTIRSAREENAGSERVELLQYEGNAGYIGACVAEALRVRDAARASGKPLLNELAIIARTNKDAGEIASVLRSHGVACVDPSPPSAFDHPAVQTTLAWARWLVSDREAQPVLDVLRSSPWNLSPQSASALYKLHRDSQAQLRHAMIAQAGPSESQAAVPRLRWNAFLTRFISEPAENASTPTFALPEEMEESAEQVRSSIASVLALHAQLKQSVLAMPASQAIEAIIQATDPTHAGLPDANERAHRLRAVLTLLRVARSKQALLPSPGGLAALLAYIDEMLKLDPALRDLRSSQIDDDAGEEWQQPEAEFAASEDVPSSPEGRVQVLTAHASKGLEFGTVIIPRITPPHGYCTTQRRDEDGGLPAGLLAFGEGAPITPDGLAAREADESRRVFYVAITRAKDRLVLLSQKRKGRSKSSNHYFQELADASASLPVLVASASAGFDAADASGELRETSLAAAGVTPRDAAQRKQSLMQQLRAQLARAIEYVLSGGARGSSVSPEDLFEQARALASPDPVAAAMALGPKHAAFVRSVQDVLAATSSLRGPAMRVPRGPLQLSYSSIHEYQYCPRCWYVKHVLNMPQPESKVALVGTVTHSALEAFYRAWSEADAEGATLPGLSQLQSLAAKQWQDAHRTAGALQSSLVEADLAHVRALLSNCWEKLHRPTDHVLETELSSNFPLEVDGMTHTMVFKIDRVDQLGDAGFRVIDYKTGRPKKQYLSPEPTDLQLGIYAMGLQHLYPGTDLAACSGEYWLLETAQRGAIRFSDLDIPSIKADIEDAVRSMLSGKFARSKKDCDGLCDILPESVVIGH